MANEETDKNRNKDLTVSDYEKIGRQITALMAGFNPSRRKIFWYNFFIGVLRGFGTVLGATIGIAILLWVLSLFSQIPLIGPFINNIKHTVNSAH